MAKDPRSGGVKTRLGGAGGAEAGRVAHIMLACTARRLLRLAGRLVVAATPDGTAAGLAGALGLDAGRVVPADQGPGDLGRRLDRVWRTVAPAGPVAFFGGDTPDVPDEALAAIGPALARADLALGPTGDGGYWTLAAGGYQPAVLAGIDWGSNAVYDQTCRRAAAVGLRVVELPPWEDVDRPEDLVALRRRLAAQAGRGGLSKDGSAPLRWMADELEQLLPTSSPRRGTPK